jgi:branched-chain amino acid transport system substrate-binding protein
MKVLPWLLVAGLLLGCSPSGPVRIGYIGGLSSSASDVDQDGRNGLMLALEQRNQAGGLHGRTLELLVQDQGRSAETAKTAMLALVAAQVDAVVGPFSSATAATIVPVANQVQLALLSPTVTSLDFVGQDDFFIRLNRNTRDNAGDYAAKLFQRGLRRVAVAYDTRNASYSSSWLREFRAAYTARGGALAAEVAFGSTSEGVATVVRSMLAGQPDGLLFIASTPDVALLAQQAEKLAPGLPKAATEWASSESLMALGGRAVEGMLTAQAFNRDDPGARYRQFHSAYVARFSREPGFSALAGFDAGTVLLQALERRAAGESVKDAILKYGPYPGLQQSIQFDRFGDATRSVYFTEVQAGHFVRIP